MTDAGAILRLEGVKKRFGSLEVLHDITLDVDEHNVVCLIGASGSGKSTLLRCINLLEPPEEGHIFLEGREITHAARKEQQEDIDYVRQRFGIVFQELNLFPH